eukprot:TRINITY_DN7785_c0_g1_i1.p1 TRINITY_DN7785_c0_g1~~TRINITY_DN7785_c0_g1_i1.p1  ORF type:complete len:414 (-),score=88.83 TRINITY_DN7785_c0_g1_i1:3-1211(-)
MADTQEVDDLRVPGAIDKHRAANEVVAKALQTLINEITPGKTVLELCILGDRIINEEVGKKYNKGKMEKGIAFPTSISVNHVVGHFSPLKDDKSVIADGDVVKIDLGAHFDGYVAVAAHTVVARSAALEEPISGRKADVICAAHFAAEAAKNLLKVGNKNSDITTAIQSIVADFNCNLVEGVLSHQLKRFVIDGDKVIINKPTPDQKVEEVVFEPYEAYAIDIVVSTGEGKSKQSDSRTTIFKRAVDQNYTLKLKSSRYVLNEISTKCSTMPFTLRAFDDEKKTRLGITELITHNLVHAYPVLLEKQGEYVAQFKFTAIILPDGLLRFSGFDLPYVSSEFSVQDPKVQEILADKPKALSGSGAAAKKKNKKKKPAKKAAAAAAASTQESVEETEKTDEKSEQ